MFLSFKKYDRLTKNRIDNIAMCSLIVFFTIIQVVLVINLYRSYQKIQKLEKEELLFEKYMANLEYNPEEYDDE